MSSDDEDSPALTFTRSVRKTRRAAPDSPENTPPAGSRENEPIMHNVFSPAAGLLGRPLLPCSAVNIEPPLRQQLAERELHGSKHSAATVLSASSSNGSGSTSDVTATELRPAVKEDELDWPAVPAPAASGASSPATPATAGSPWGSLAASPSPPPAAAGAAGRCSSSPSTPAAAPAAGGVLDIDDPFTPWLKTSSKPARCQQEQGFEQEALAATADGADGALLCSPLSASSSSGGASDTDTASSASRSSRHTPCSALPAPQQQQQQLDTQAGGGHAAAAAEASPLAPADLAGAGACSSGGGSCSDKEDEEEQLLTFSRRRVLTRARTQPWQQQQCRSSSIQRRRVAAWSSDGSSDDGGSSDGESDASQKRHDTPAAAAAAGAAAATPAGCSSHQPSAAAGSCGVCSAGRSGCSGRVTPGSSSSLVARRRRRQQRDGRLLQPTANKTPSQQQEQQQQQTVDEFDIETMLSAPRTGLLVIRGALSPQSPESDADDAAAAAPRARLAFTPAAVQSQPIASPVSPLQLQRLADTGEPVTPAAALAAGSTAARAGAPQALEAPDSCFSFAALRSPAPLGLGHWAAAAVTPPQLLLLQGSSPSRQQQQPAGFSTTLKPGGTGRAVGGRWPAGGSSRKGGGAAVAGGAGARTAPPKAASSRTFARQRQQLSQQLYAEWNLQVFDGGLPSDLPLVWNPRLTSTAGQVVDDGSANHTKGSSEERVPVRLELSTKVLDGEARLRTTLAHEMCHVGAWALSREFRQHHGPAFWSWAARFEARVAGISITTCHNYDVHAPFRWQCCNPECGKQYHRHKRSIDPARHCCSRCSGRLTYLGKFSRDGRVVAAATPGPGTPGAAAAGRGGGNVFSQFVKQHFGSTKKAMPAGTPHREVMSRLAADYKQQKAQQASAAAGAAAAAGSQQGQQQQHEEAPLLDAGGDAANADASGGCSSSNAEEAQQDRSAAESLLSFMDRLALVDG